MNNYIPLQNLLQCRRPVNMPLVMGEGQTKTWGDWLQRVSQWRESIAAVSGQRFALYCDDSFEFAAILFALWAENKIACVPGSNLPEVAKQLAQRVDAFIGEFESQECVACVATASEFLAKPVELVLDENKIVLEVFTSGSTGQPSAICKELSQLNNEVQNLHAVWGDVLHDAVIIGTVSHHHIYGMLFRVFLPLAAGLRFHPHVCEFFEEVQRVSSDFDQVGLISSPTHLTRVPDTDWQVFRERCVAIFSSGAPLSAEGSADSREKFGLLPFEVFGSSETGGIAWRQQSASEEVFWRPFPGIEVALDEESSCLNIRSPYLPRSERDDWYATPDIAVLDSNNYFQLRGRADSIVKVEGKRVSLTDIEQRLAQHDWVVASKLLLLEGQRTQLGAVVELTELGLQALSEQGKRAVNKMLQIYLADQFDRPVLPRRWRYCEQMPYTSQGKLVRATLLAMFE